MSKQPANHCFIPKNKSHSKIKSQKNRPFSNLVRDWAAALPSRALSTFLFRRSWDGWPSFSTFPSKESFHFSLEWKKTCPNNQPTIALSPKTNPTAKLRAKKTGRFQILSATGLPRSLPGRFRRFFFGGPGMGGQVSAHSLVRNLFIFP